MYTLNRKQNRIYNEKYDEYKTICKFQNLSDDEILNYSQYFDEILNRGHENIMGIMRSGKKVIKK